MAIEVFNRYENKYILKSNIIENFQKKLSEFMELDDYNKDKQFYTITNLYYDTQDNYLIRNSLLKPNYKEKLRLRSYGVPESQSKIYLEIKKKVNGLVNKRRTSIKLDTAYTFIDTQQTGDVEIDSSMNKQVLSEVTYLIKKQKLYPKVYIAYDRVAYFGIGNDDLRISFDTHIRTRDYDLKLENGDYGNEILDEGEFLMEIKVANNIPIWLSRLLSEFKIYPVSFSKYGKVYSNSLVEKPALQKIFYIPKSNSENNKVLVNPFGALKNIIQ